MSVETGSSIADLNPAWPRGTDSPQEGDDHMRIIKSILQSQFPNLNAPTPITDEELNAIVQGVADAVQKAGDEMTGDLELLGGAGVAFKVLSEDNIFAKVYGDTDKIFVDIIDPADGTTVLHQIQFDADGLWVKGDFRVDGDATAVTPPEGDNSTLLATTAFVERRASKVEGILHVRDEKAQGVEGGEFDNGAWRTRTLNTPVLNTIDGAALSSNRITLPAGSFVLTATAPGYQVRGHQARIQSISGDTISQIGTTERSGGSSDAQTVSRVTFAATLTEPTVIELQHYCASWHSVGFGNSANIGTEVYAEVFIRQLA